MAVNEWTTPAPLIDLTVEFPELAPYARTTTRLHPRRGEPSMLDSSLGGPMLWPADEPWPVQPGSHFGPFDDEPVPAVPLLQLYRRDVAQLAFPEAADLLQLLWYPIEHETTDTGDPEIMMVWRDAASVTETLTEVPRGEATYPYVPFPCVLHPEPGVVEYPSRDADLPEGWDWSRLEAFEEQSGWNAFNTLFVASGIKVGGWPNFYQEPVWSDCPDCGRRMDHLLSLDVREWNGESWKRWIPRADARFRVGLPNRTRLEGESAAQFPSGIDLGGGCITLFYCPQCPHTPHAQWYDR